MTEATIVAALKSQLEDDSNLSSVKNFFVGVRERISTYPTIIIDYLGSDESDELYDKQQVITHLSVTGIIHTTQLSQQVDTMLDLKTTLSRR